MRTSQENKQKTGLRRETGFTLIEVLTVAAMIAILASMAVVSMRGGRRIAFETRAIAAMKNIAENEIMFYGRYREFGTWNEMRAEGDLIDPGYDPIDDLTDPVDTPDREPLFDAHLHTDRTPVFYGVRDASQRTSEAGLAAEHLRCHVRRWCSQLE